MIILAYLTIITSIMAYEDSDFQYFINGGPSSNFDFFFCTGDLNITNFDYAYNSKSQLRGLKPSCGDDKGQTFGQPISSTIGERQFNIMKVGVVHHAEGGFSGFHAGLSTTGTLLQSYSVGSVDSIKEKVGSCPLKGFLIGWTAEYINFFLPYFFCSRRLPTTYSLMGKIDGDVKYFVCKKGFVTSISGSKLEYIMELKVTCSDGSISESVGKPSLFWYKYENKDGFTRVYTMADNVFKGLLVPGYTTKGMDLDGTFSRQYRGNPGDKLLGFISFTKDYVNSIGFIFGAPD
jgi:hypothetical protein